MDTQGSTQGSTQATQAGDPVKHGPTSYTISGVKVEFPTKAYPCQIAMMSKVIQGLKNRSNCLLESPTGSGKTLALLCAALAWQRHESVRVAEYNAAIDARNEELEASLKQTSQRISGSAVHEESTVGDTKSGEPDSGNENIANSTNSSQQKVIDLSDEDDDDFKPSTKRQKSAVPVVSSPSVKEVPAESLIDKAKSGADNTGGFVSESIPSTNDGSKPYFVPPDKKLTVPKIFFGTRTHKQIAQITRELRKTFYKPVRSVVLASREYTCVNPLVEGRPNKNEACRELLDTSGEMGGGCNWQSSAKKLGTFPALAHFGVTPGYDLEDFVKVGREVRACPYYATRFLMTNADIIFCPYNYIIDRNIRRSMNIELENQIVIFDEAHNMEDASREAASFSIKQIDLQKAMQDCEKVKALGGAEPHALGEMAELLSALSTWIDVYVPQLKELSYNTFGKFWTGTEVTAALSVSGLNKEKINAYEVYFKALIAQRERDIEISKERGNRYSLEVHGINSATIGMLESVFRLFENLQFENGMHRDDFRIALLKSTEKRREHETRGRFITVSTFTLNVWCLNPAVSFGEIRDQVHSIVLTSGTLSPMDSFQSELSTPFPLKLEASHVIEKNQVWAGVIGSGPNGVNLNGSYQNAESYGYQDELGVVVQQVCDTIPFGVLCFFSSYRMMEKVIERWQITQRYNKIERKKAIVVEPRGSGSNFENVMAEFYSAVKDYEQNGSVDGNNTGAIFFAVCRGKVSEGLDFSDNNARAVICIGIPFPNYRDLQVELKRNYNQLNKFRGLLSGSDWYEIQAFRALNQALGRCIRHRQDWGAIILVDDRYIQNQRYISSLSKWIRSSVRNFRLWSGVHGSLNSFKEEMLSRSFPVETSFTSEVVPAFESSMSSVVPLKDGRGNDLGNGGEEALPLSSIPSNRDSAESSQLENQLPSSFDNFNEQKSSNRVLGHHRVFLGHEQPHKGNFRQHSASPAPKSTAIAALFARQRPKTNATVIASSGTGSKKEDDANLDTSRPNKRARGKQIRL